MDNNLKAAAALVCLGCAVLGFTDNHVRTIAEDMGLWQFHLLRSAMGLPLVALVALGLGLRFWPRLPGRVLARSAFQAGAMFLYFGSLAVLPIGEVVAGLYTAPIFVLLMSRLIWGERIGALRVGAVLLGFLGILIILRPDRAEGTLLSLVPVVAGLFYAVSLIATRRWCAGESTLTLNAGFFLLMGIGGLLGAAALSLWPAAAPAGTEGFVLRGWVQPSWDVLLLILMQAVGSLVGIGLIIRGYQLADASYVAVFEYALLIFAAAWAFVLWDEAPDPLALAGMAAIVAAGSIIALRRG